jgi:hypothetical protein
MVPVVPVWVLLNSDAAVSAVKRGGPDIFESAVTPTPDLLVGVGRARYGVRVLGYYAVIGEELQIEIQEGILFKAG